MTISTRRIESGSAAPGAADAFTLVETMIAAALSTVVLVGVLSAFLMIGRTSLNSSNYSEIEAETRRALELFGQDARRASDVHWNSDQSVTLTLPETTGSSSSMTYAYDGTAGSATQGCFFRVAGSETSVAPRQVLAHNVDGLIFQRYKLEQPGATNEATNDLETKQLQVTFRTVRRAASSATSQAALSACYILRNKRVAN